MKNLLLYALMSLSCLTAFAMEQDESFSELSSIDEVKQSTTTEFTSMKEHLEELFKYGACPLASIEKKLIALLSKQDLKRLLTLLDKDVLGKQKEILRHIIFLKYLISCYSREHYSDTRIAQRLQIYNQVLKKSQRTPAENQWLEQHKQLDDLLLEESQTIPHDVKEHFLGALIDLAACLHIDLYSNPIFLTKEPKGEIQRFKEASWYCSYDYLTAFGPHYKDILYETIVNLIKLYSRNEATLILQGISERAKTLRKEIVKTSRANVRDKALYDESRITSVPYVKTLLDTLSGDDLKSLFYLSVHPFLSPNATRDAFAFKCIATTNPFNPAPPESGFIKNIKELTLKVLSYNQPSKAYCDKASLGTFMQDMKKALDEGKVSNLSSSLLRYASDIKKMSPERKEAFNAFGRAIYSQHCKEQQDKEEMEKEIPSPQKRKHSQISSQESLSNASLNIATTIFTLLKTVDTPNVNPLLKHLFTQSPFKELIASREERYRDTIVSKNETIAALEDRRAQLITHNNELTLEKSNLWDQAEKIRHQNTEIQKAYTSLTQSIQEQAKSLEETNAKLSKEYVELYQEHRICSNRELTLSNKIAALHEQLTAAQEQTELLSRQVAALQDLNSTLDQDKSLALSQAESLQQQLTAQQEATENLSSELEKIKKAHTVFERAYTKFNKTFK